MTLPRVLSESLGGSPLALAAERGERLEWYRRRPQGADEWRDYLRRVAAGHAQRAWLDALRPALTPVGAAAARLERVSGGGGVVISTGQQAALFGGPLYTLIKGLSALAVADELARATGIPTAPVFWAATDDSDYAEANWAAVAVPGGLRRLELPPLARAGIPMSDVPLPRIDHLIEQLAEACGAAVSPDMLEIVRRAYAPPATLGGAYREHLRAILQPLGIAVLDASHPAVRRAAAPVLFGALEKAPALERALAERFEAIRRAGFTPQVEHISSLTLVFASSETGEKQRVPLHQAGETRARADVTSLGPNVLLRPLVERFIMPSAAYIAGPGELSYFAQLSAAAEILDVEAPLGLPRWSATIIEPRIERLLARLGVSLAELREPHAVQGRLARDAMPTDVMEALRDLRRDVESDVTRLEEVNRDNLVPPASLEGLKRSLRHRLDRAERRFVAGVKRRETDLMHDIATVVASLYPDGARQERVLNFVPFLARYGAPLVDLLRAEAARHAGGMLGLTDVANAASIAEPV